MNWLFFAFGLVIGGALAYLYVTYGTITYKLGENLLARAKGDVKAAWSHIGKL